MSLLPPIPTIPRALAQSVACRPEHIAIDEDGVLTTYAQLDRAALRVSRALMAHGIQSGDLVAIWAPNCTEWVVAALGILGTGAGVVPVNTRMKGVEAAYVLQKSRARLLLSVGNFLGLDYPAMLRDHLPATIEKVLLLRNAPAADADNWERFLVGGDAVSEAAARARAMSVTPDMMSDVLFTSGTTGHPKGVITSHGKNLRTMDDWSEVMQLVPEDRYLMVNPFFHAMGYKAGWMVGILNGLTLMPMAVFEAGKVLELIEHSRVSVLPGPPTIYHSMRSHSNFARTDLSSLRAAITGSTSIMPELIESMRRDFGFKIVLVGYGLTECCGTAALSSPSDDAQTIAITTGRAIRDVEICIMDLEGKLLPAGEQGEVMIRGYNVMSAYLDDPEATREAITADGWLHSGDIGVLDERGYLRITDRLKDMFIVGGFNCYPAEIERLASRHPDVAQVAIVGAADQRLGEVGRAFVVLKPGAVPDALAFLAWCRDNMANYKVPRYVEFIDALPINAGGKVLRRELRATALLR
jgi:acyl-CoA synthetase (AMP-forming)/AMP-acid ligase II